jgi:eukaryotic-like serine/threonine-protein kinase
LQFFISLDTLLKLSVRQELRLVYDKSDAPAGRRSTLATPRTPDPLVGSRHRNYRILELCGEGSLSQVYKARDAVLDRFVALKVTRTEAPEFAPLMLRREARILAQLAPHPFIVPVYEAGAVAGRAFIAIEYLPHSLDQLLLRHPHGLPIAHALAVAKDIGVALGHAHARGIVHRDVKPSSLLLDDAKRTVRLSDFNLATMIDPETGRATAGPNGTLKYMAPEQRAGAPLTAAADVYALGVTLRELLFGKNDVNLDRLSDPVSALIRTATSEHPEDRYPNGRAFAEALHGITASSTAAARVRAS